MSLEQFLAAIAATLALFCGAAWWLVRSMERDADRGKGRAMGKRPRARKGPR